MIAGLPLAFGAPLVLAALVLLPAIWWLLKLTPPKPRLESFPPTRILAEIARRDEQPARSPWWLTALRLPSAARSARRKRTRLGTVAGRHRQ